MADPEVTAATSRLQLGMVELGAEEAGPGNFRQWEEEAAGIMAAEAVGAADSLLGVGRLVLPEVPPEFFPVAVAAAGRETTLAPQRM